MNALPRTPRASSGFTLVEVLVAMMIMAILAVMAWQGVDGIVRARDASQQRLERTLRLNTVLAQWEQDLAAVQDTGAAPGFSFDGATVRMTRRAEGGMQVVAWSLRPAPEGGTGGGSLWRWAGPVVTANKDLQEMWMRTQQFQGNEIGQLRTLDGVAQWQVYCFWGSWANCQSTGNLVAAGQIGSVALPPAQAASGGAGAASGASATPTRSLARQALPAGVRMLVQFGGGDIDGSLTRDVALGP